MKGSESPCNHCTDYLGWIHVRSTGDLWVDRPWCQRHDEVCQPQKHGCIKEGIEARDIDLSNIHTVCNDCARMLGFTPKDKAVGVWVGKCGVCHQHKPCTDLWHDWEPATKGETK